MPLKGTEGSNPSLSAKKKATSCAWLSFWLSFEETNKNDNKIFSFALADGRFAEVGAAKLFSNSLSLRQINHHQMTRLKVSLGGGFIMWYNKSHITVFLIGKSEDSGWCFNYEQ